MKPILQSGVKSTSQPKKQVLIVDNKNDPDAFPKVQKPTRDLAEPVGQALATKVYKRASVEAALNINRRMGSYVHEPAELEATSSVCHLCK